MLSSKENPGLEFPEMIASQIVTAFFASSVSIVAAGKSALKEIAGKLSQHSQVTSLWRILAEVFQCRRFSGL